MEHREPKLFLGRELAAVLGRLRRNRDQVATRAQDLVVCLIQSFQLRIAIRSPPATIERQDHRSARYQGLEADHLPVGVLEFEVGRRLADL